MVIEYLLPVPGVFNTDGRSSLNEQARTLINSALDTRRYGRGVFNLHPTTAFSMDLWDLVNNDEDPYLRVSKAMTTPKGPSLVTISETVLEPGVFYPVGRADRRGIIISNKIVVYKPTTEMEDNPITTEDNSLILATF